MSDTTTAEYVPGPLPAGLDARAVLRFTLHCSHCGKVHREPEYDSITTWHAEDLRSLSAYIDSDSGWELDVDGRALVCPSCRQVGWCEDCGGEIRAWERYKAITDAADDQVGELIHTKCPEFER